MYTAMQNKSYLFIFKKLSNRKEFGYVLFR